MPKLTKPVLNAQARAGVFNWLDQIASDNGGTKIDNSYFFITQTDEGDRLVEMSLKVRELSLKPQPQAANISFDTPQAMLEYLMSAKDAKVTKAYERQIEKDKLKAQDIARKEKMAAKQAAQAAEAR